MIHWRGWPAKRQSFATAPERRRPRLSIIRCAEDRAKPSIGDDRAICFRLLRDEPGGERHRCQITFCARSKYQLTLICRAVNCDRTASIQFPAEEGLHEFGAGNQGDRYRFEATCCLMRSPSKAKEPDAQPNDQRTKP